MVRITYLPTSVRGCVHASNLRRYMCEGGNCQTAMIATMSLETDNLSETLSTCRFAQRVACIKNIVR